MSTVIAIQGPDSTIIGCDGRATSPEGEICGQEVDKWVELSNGWAVGICGEADAIETLRAAPIVESLDTHPAALRMHSGPFDAKREAVHARRLAALIQKAWIEAGAGPMTHEDELNPQMFPSWPIDCLMVSPTGKIWELSPAMIPRLAERPEAGVAIGSGGPWAAGALDAVKHCREASDGLPPCWDLLSVVHVALKVAADHDAMTGGKVVVREWPPREAKP